MQTSRPRYGTWDYAEIEHGHTNDILIRCRDLCPCLTTVLDELDNFIGESEEDDGSAGEDQGSE
jgi:hypothetical protein